MSEIIFSTFRFVAAIIVVLFHYQGESVILKNTPSFLTAGPQMVTYFFVLSGFVLMIAYGQKEIISYKSFFYKRFIRILPLYYLALAIVFILDAISGNSDIIGFLLSIFLIQTWIPSYALVGNTPGWFVSNLVSFYLIFPMILWFLKSKNIKPSNILLLSLVVWGGGIMTTFWLLNTSFYKGYPSASHNFIYYFPLVHLGSFLMGIAGGYFFIQNKTKIKQNIAIVSSIITLGLLMLLIEYESTIENYFDIKIPFTSNAYAPFFLLIIYLFAHINAFKIPLKFKNIIIALGVLSFPIYIMQAPVQSIVFKLLNYTTFTYDIKLGIYIMVLIIISYGIVRWVEKPLVSFLRKFSPDIVKTN